MSFDFLLQPRAVFLFSMEENSERVTKNISTLECLAVSFGVAKNNCADY